MGIVYRITSPEGMSYVGQTKRSVKARMYDHRSSGSECPSIHSAIEKYGMDRMVVEVLEECDDDELDERESYWIEELGTIYPNGYNMTTGGVRFKTIEEVRKRISSSKMGHEVSEETRSKLSEWRAGRKFGPLPQETRDKIRQSLNKKTRCVETGVVYDSARDAAASVCGDFSSICKACRGVYKTAYGYHWEYVE